MVSFIVLISVSLSILFFWRSLYLPELKNHARYLTSELQLMNSVNKDWKNRPEVRQWIYQHSHVVVVNNPNDFPAVSDKAFVGVFTDVLQREIGAQLGRPVEVYFKFKPTPQLWVQDSRDDSFWIREPVVYYSQYSPALLVLFLIAADHYSTGAAIKSSATIFAACRDQLYSPRSCHYVANTKRAYGDTSGQHGIQSSIHDIKSSTKRAYDHARWYLA